MGSRFPPLSPVSLDVDTKPDCFECDSCSKRIEGQPAGHGLYLWTRGEEVRYEEPPLCANCANAIGLAALALWELEEDGE